MKNLTIESIAKACNGEIVATDEQLAALSGVEVKGVVIDNRKVQPGYVFIPTVGARVDGHTFIDKALEDGALFTLSEKRLDSPKGAYVLVDKSEKALAEIATYYRLQLDIPIIGITGSVGKTGTKEMIASVLGEAYNVLKTEGNLNNEIGLPLTLLSIKEEHEAAVVEMGISGFGEMHRLGTMAKPDVMVITNIGTCHLEQLGDRDGVFKAKTEVFEHLNNNAFVVINVDDDKLSAVREVSGATVIGFGKENRDQATVFAKNVSAEGLLGVDCTIEYDTASFDAHIPLAGEHNVYHALAAAAVGLALDIEKKNPGAVKAGIEKITTIAGRSNFLSLADNITVIDDCYNASPASVKAALVTLSKAEGRKIAVIGDMGELGTDEAKLHREVGEHLDGLGIDKLYVAGKLVKNLVEGAENSGTDCHYFEDREDMTKELLDVIEPNDVILVKASHFMEFPKVVSAIKEKFS